MNEQTGKTVLWISRHQMTEGQLADLQRVVGGPVRIEQWADTVHSMTELETPVERADVVAAVLPLDMLAELLRIAGERPVLQAVSRRLPTGKTNTLPDGRSEAEFCFVHDFWQQLLRVEVETRRL